jgi:hypothetical protein
MFTKWIAMRTHLTHPAPTTGLELTPLVKEWLTCTPMMWYVDKAFFTQSFCLLTTDRQLCDDCFVQMLYTKVTSEFLADTDHADYLVDQLQDIADVCNTSIPAITTRATITWDSAPAPTPTAITTTPPPASTTCVAGQGQTLSSGTGCDALSQKYGIATGDLEAISGSDACSISKTSCYPSPCSLQQVAAGATWLVRCVDKIIGMYC